MDWPQFFFVVFVGIPLIALWIGVLVDIFRRTDLSGLAIAGWIVLLLVFPLIGAIVYFAMRPKAPTLRGGGELTPEELERRAATEHALTYDTPGGMGPATTIPPRSK